MILADYEINLGHVKIDGEMTWVTLEVKLEEKTEQKPVLTISGNITRHSAGQVRDTIEENIQNFPAKDRARVANICRIWKLYHLNDLHAGTPKQEAVIAVHEKEYEAQTELDHYTWARNVLSEAGLLKDGGYEYGTKWLYEEIPASIIEEVKRGL